MITVLAVLAVDSATKTFAGVVLAAIIGAVGLWWGAHLTNRQATKDGQTAYYAALTTSQHVILEEREDQIRERDQRISSLEVDVRGLRREIGVLHAEMNQANRRERACQEKYDVALQEILSLRRQVAGD